MIHEYALDPSLLDTWERIRYYVEKFGYDKRRLISRYPRKWKKMVWESVRTSRDAERKRVEVFLTQVDQLLVEKDRRYDGDLPWLDNAEQEHARLPFRAVLSTVNPRGHAFVVANDQFAESHPLLSFPAQEMVKRTPEALGDFLAPIFARAKRVLLIDPHFDPQPGTNINPPKFRASRWHLPLIIFLGKVGAECQIEYHALRQTNRGSRVPFGDDHNQDMTSWAEACTAALPHVLPKGSRLAIFRWQERDGGRQFHARYLVTDQCAVMIDPGLDADRNTANEFAEISCLNEANRYELETRYATDATEYKLLSRHEIEGIGDCLPRGPR
jgi:hypothetical protein